MKQPLLTGLLFATALCLPGMSQECRAYDIVAPEGLNATVNGMVVDLTWEWGNEGELVLFEDFEGDEFPSSAWSIKDTYSYDEIGKWMQYDFSDEPDDPLTHSGLRCAMLMMGNDNEDNPSASHQDEWLIVRPGEGAAYMDFWYFLHPELLDVGGYKDFPDHYYVMISFDNGKNWEELWDGRWDMGNEADVQQASLFLGGDTDEDTLVAFRAVSGENESLYFLWCVDDVEFYAADEVDTRALKVNQRVKHDMPQALAGRPLKREFTPSAIAQRVKRAPESEWLNNGNTTYRVYLDDKIVGDYLKTRHFTDYSSKEVGIHTYRVMAWSEAMDEEFDAASVDVAIGEVVFPAPRNVKASYTEQEDGKYIIQASWDEPEGDITPSYYLVYVNGKSMGWIDAGEEMRAGQSGMYKGAYTFEVEACYVYPEGSSVKVAAMTFPGTVPTPSSLTAKKNDGSVQLTWKAPAEGDAPAGYAIYRGDDLIAANHQSTEFTDEHPAAGTYYYNVHAVYADGVQSLPATCRFKSGNPADVWAPYSVDFNNGHLPLGWEVELIDPNERVKDMYSWRGDNWFEYAVPAEAGLNGGFISTNGLAAGMNRLETYISTPLIYLPDNGGATLTFTKFFEELAAGPTGPAAFQCSISTDEGQTWNSIENLVEVPNGKVTVPLSDYDGRKVMLRWEFLGRNSGFAAIDDVVFDADTSGVEEVEAAADDCIDIFSIDGTVVAKSAERSLLRTLPGGIYLLRHSDGRTEKVRL